MASERLRLNSSQPAIRWSVISSHVCWQYFFWFCSWASRGFFQRKTRKTLKKGYPQGRGRGVQGVGTSLIFPTVSFSVRFLKAPAPRAVAVSPVGGNNNRPLRKRLPSWKTSGSEAFFEPWASKVGLARANMEPRASKKMGTIRGGFRGGRSKNGGFVSACIHCTCFCWSMFRSEGFFFQGERVTDIMARNLKAGAYRLWCSAVLLHAAYGDAFVSPNWQCMRVIFMK